MDRRESYYKSRHTTDTCTHTGFMMSTQENGLHLVMFPWLAFGHISPFVQLSNKLSSHGVRISFFTASANVHRIKTMLNPTPTTQIIPLSLPHVDGLPPGIESTSDTSPATSELLKVALDLIQPQIKTLLSHLKPHFVIFDFAQEWLPSMASQLGIKTIFYSVFTVVSSAFLTVPARLSHPTQTTPTIQELKNPPPGFPQTVNVTSVKTFEARDLLYIFKSFHGSPTVFHRLLTGLMGCTAILVKSCMDMEAPYIDYVNSQFNKPVLLIGPVVPEPHSDKLDERWATWLDQFSPKSIIYCSFGSETFLKDDQIKQLALGLELTGLPFFLVLNFSANLDSSTELQRALPEGFLERVKERGVVHSGWVQQRHILAHDSVGCYVCHAGFSSVIEALVNDCQLVLLPQKGDQFLNSKLVGLDWKAGVEVNRKDEDGYFGKDDVCEAVKRVMVDVDREPAKSIRDNHKKWREFLQNNEIQNKFITDLVKGMKALSKQNI